MCAVLWEIIRTFDFVMTDYISISAFLIGITTAFFTIFAVHILGFRRRRTRFQTVLGCIMAVWAVWSAKDLIITLPGMYRTDVLRWIMIIDGWSALTFMVFMAETVWPGWANGRRMLLAALPFAAFTVAYGLWPAEEVVYGYVAFLWCFAWGVVFVGTWVVGRRIKYIRANYSNIEHIDVSWLNAVFFFVIVSQLAWLVTSLYASVIGDILYYVAVIMLWLMVLHYSWNFRPITVVDEEPEPAPAEEPSAQYKAATPLADGQLEQLMEQRQLYLNSNLTLQDLAQALNTNRTYVSNYLSQVLGQTFYDYINQLRIERVSLPMMRSHPEFKLEHVAKESGFASISTFRRAFIKLTGQTPSQFQADDVA